MSEFNQPRDFINLRLTLPKENSAISINSSVVPYTEQFLIIPVNEYPRDILKSARCAQVLFTSASTSFVFSKYCIHIFTMIYVTL